MKRKTRLFGYFIVLIIIFLLSTLVYGLMQSSSLPELQSTNCQRTCWHGIEPGITTLGETIQILTERELPFEIKHYWFEHYNLYVYVTISHAIGSILYSEEEIVGTMIVPVDYCISAILDAFGIPDGVYAHDGYYALAYVDAAVLFTNSEHGEYPDLTRVYGAMMGSIHIENMAPFESWEDYAEVFAGQCVD